ncbi:uncharacterized protein G2W53_013920 [Senna tora]|uniref:Uncharacterized protein n=1 Tax=Senna tora TaxID=362788 RepID=A0A834U042_9FABA|nr:uncharacterized protein G2W53_013920 [Senna tora]
MPTNEIMPKPLFAKNPISLKYSWAWETYGIRGSVDLTRHHPTKEFKHAKLRISEHSENQRPI